MTNLRRPVALLMDGSALGVEDTIRQLLLQSESDDENSSGSERENYVEADTVFRPNGDEEFSSLTRQHLSGQDDQKSSDTPPLQSIEDSIPISSIQSSDLIIRPSHNILRGKDIHKWSSLKSRSQSKTASRNIVHVRPEPIGSCNNELDPLQ
ncbi:hypothetical protein EVAR_27880_1 [Eumeta japonica]|uniref:Uncharacterized protein n=1 Tax=Eumeta variegata TaxID=151549 RepID=A0A4C1UUZ9_EUMVA|nr:hypothetical protein EVAR_27880_1 [Eumeta japonica]